MHKTVLECNRRLGPWLREGVTTDDNFPFLLLFLFSGGLGACGLLKTPHVQNVQDRIILRDKLGRNSVLL